MKFHNILTLIFLFLFTSTLSAQRKMETLDRGVVAVKNSTGGYFVSWRTLAGDAADLKFNLYAKTTGSYVKMNAQPLSYSNYALPSGILGAGSQLYVTTVLNEVESAPSGIFTIGGIGMTSYRSGYMDISYNPSSDNLPLHRYYTKFCWPVDLNGDGEYDFVVDRLCNDGSSSHKIQAYLRDGTYLWTVDMGPNVSISEGQDDMVIAYDMDGDGRGEVVVKSSDGTRFSDGKYPKGSTNADTDGDGIVNYETQSVKNPPQYISVIDGMTGHEKNSLEMTYPSNYTRTNKALFMSGGYSNLNGHMAILYLDGKHPSVGFIYKTRTVSDQYHWYSASAYGYNASGQWVNWYNWERGLLDAAEAHSIRVADVDLDGRDELLDIGYGIQYDGTLAFNAHLSHGDRFRVADIDPERPGLETFAIQQNAPSMLGQLVYDAATGSAIRKVYMSSLGDVGRGECMDVDSTHLGYEFWSTMPNIYDAKGNIIYEGSTPFPFEGLWWDGDLAREELASTDGNGFNADVRKYSISSHAFGTRLIEFAKMTNYAVKSEYGVRPAFFGDIAGDWREEVILEKKGSVMLKDVNGADSVSVSTCPGIAGFSTDYPTTNRLYCLMQNPAYRSQATTKGYYQSPFPDFYLGFGMPTPPVPPIQKAKLTWSAGSSWNKSSTNFKLSDETTTSTFADGDDVLFDLSGSNSSEIQLGTNLAPSALKAMNPKGHDFTLSGSGKLTGAMTFLKSLNGTFTLNGNHDYTGATTISEGRLVVNGSLASPVTVSAKGTLGGNALLNANLAVQAGLNLEGGRLAPGNGLAAGKLGKIVVNGGGSSPESAAPPMEPSDAPASATNGKLTLAGGCNLEFDLLPTDSYKNDSIQINGDLLLSGVNNVVLNTLGGTLAAGSYTLMTWSGSVTGSTENLTIKGLTGLPMNLQMDAHALRLVVDETRPAAKVQWHGGVDGNWDFQTNNFRRNGADTYFVNGDTVEFNDAAVVKSVTLTDQMATAGTVFANNQPYVLNGTGGIAGSGDLVKSGRGLLDIQNSTNTYTGRTLLTNATVQVTALADAGTTSSLGLGGRGVDSLVLSNSKLLVNAVSTNTNRGMTLSGSDTINVLRSNGMVSLTGVVAGTGTLVKEGLGQLNLSGSVANTYTGGTVIDGSTLALGSLAMNSNGLGTGPITLKNGGVLSMFYNIGDYNQKPTWSLTVPTGQEGSLLASGRCNINGTLSGGGTLHYDVPYSRADLVMNCSGFSGTMHVTTDADGGDFRITTNPNGLPLCNVNLDARVRMGAYSSIGASSTSNSTSVTVGSLAGVKGSYLAGGTWRIGNNNVDAVFNGIISSGATVTKIGTGSWTLTDSSTCTSAFTVSAGRLVVANTLKSATGSGAVTVATGAFLSGTGTIAGNTTVSGTLEGSLNFGGNLTLAGTTNLTVSGFATGQYDVVNVAGTVTNGGTLTITVSSSVPVYGTSINLVNAGAYTGSFTTVNCPAGYSYNAATGTLTCIGYAWSGIGSWTNTANWRNGSLPASGGIILVESGLLTISQNVTTGDFHLSPSAKVTIANGYKLTVNGALTLQPTATLVDQNLTNGLAVSGGTNVYQTLSGAGGSTPNGRFWYVASPVVNANSTAFAVSSSNPVNKIWSFAESTQSYTQITNSVALTPGSGYVARLGAPKAVNFSGTLPNSGDQSIPVTRTGTSNPKRGFNLVGNPYPSFVELNPSDNPGLESTLWFRSLTANAANMVFDTYNIQSNVQVVASGSGSLSRAIPPMQAFWVKVSTDGATGKNLVFRNANRSHQTGVSLRSESLVQQGIRLELSNGFDRDETYIGFYEEANDGFDAWDSHKMSNENQNIPELFSFAGSDQVAINGMAVLTSGKMIRLGFRTGKSGTFNIKLMQGLSDGKSVYLTDSQFGVTQDLLCNPNYTFSTESGENLDRFTLKITDQSTLLHSIKAPFMAEFDDCRHLVLSWGGATDLKVRLMQIDGKQVDLYQVFGGRFVSSQSFLPGVYLLEAATGNERWIQKVIAQ